jgi:hypothetical protein
MNSHITTRAPGSAADGYAAVDPVSPWDGQSEPTAATPVLVLAAPSRDPMHHAYR